MRTTLTLDDDVAAKLEKLRVARRESFKDLVNEALRRGLGEMTARPKKRETFRTNSVSLGRCLVGNVDNVSDALAFAEGETFR
ncbi:MAG: ribbon-helix-helix protein, CopG family [Candidatus Binatia bacterium]